MLASRIRRCLEAVNSVVPAMLNPRESGTLLLYLYGDFLRVFDPGAAVDYGVYYTPPEVVRFIVAEADRALRERPGH